LYHGGMIDILRISGVATIQDGGRPGRRSEGIPPGGALVPEALAVANLAAGNAWDAPAIELVGGLEVRCAAPLFLGSVPSDGQIAPARSVRYLAVAGGIDAPWVFGGRGTSWQAGIGTPLRPGDSLSLGAAGSGRLPPRASVGPLRVVPGPDLDAFEDPAELFAIPWTVAGGDRVALRLDGGRIRRKDKDDRASTPMTRGAIQVPADGRPVVLGPDHPTTGGYPVIGVVRTIDWGRLGALLPGDGIRWVPA
jgi:allophanate hydrolase subunit 2